jgi:sulfur carrier protein ThiS
MDNTVITLIHRKQEHHIPGPLKVKQALEKLDLMVESYLVLRNGELLVETDLLRNGDVVKLIATISGG